MKVLYRIEPFIKYTTANGYQPSFALQRKAGWFLPVWVQVMTGTHQECLTMLKHLSTPVIETEVEEPNP